MIRRTLVALSLSMLAVAVAAPAHAQPAAQAEDDGPEPKARALFDEGVALFNAGKVQAACAKLEASLALYAGIGTRGKLAECYEKLGRTASAYALYREVAKLSAESGEVRREQVAKQRASALEPKLSYVTVAVPPSANIPGLVVKKNGQTLPHTKLGAAEPTDPGQVAFEISAPGHQTVTSTRDVAEGQSVTFTVPILPLTSTTGTGSEPPPPTSGTVIPPSLVVMNDAPQWPKPLGLALTGVGAAAVVIGGAFGLSAKSTYDDAFDSGACDAATNQCSVEGQDRVESARSKATVSTALVIGGAVVAASGLVMFLVAPSSSRQSKSGLRVAPTPYAGGAGLTLAGAL